MPSVDFDLPVNAASTPVAKDKTSSRKHSSSGRLDDLHFRVAHQRIVVDVDLAERVLGGYTELTIIPLDPSIRFISLDCRQMSVEEATVNSQKATFYYNDFVSLTMPPGTDIHQHKLQREKLHRLLKGTTSGELLIELPENLKITTNDVSVLAQAISGTSNNSPDPHLTSFLTPSNTGHDLIYTPLTIKIRYSVKNPVSGLCFIGGSHTSLDKSEWHAYTNNSAIGVSTSCWVPCIDSLWERCTWQLEIGTPRNVGLIGKSKLIGDDLKLDRRKSLSNIKTEELQSNTNTADDGGANDEDKEDDDDANDEMDVIVACGDLSAKENAHPLDITKKVTSFSVFNPVSAHHIGFMVGVFQKIPLPSFAEDEDENDNTTSIPAAIYCRPSQVEEAKNTCLFMYKAIDFYSNEFGSFPFSSYSLCFVEDLPIKVANFAGLSIFSNELLYTPDMIEPILKSTEDLSIALASQWSGVNMVPKNWNDMWLTMGISSFMAGQFSRRLFGNNQFKYQMKRASREILQQDIGKPPIGNPNFNFPISDEDLEFIKLKSPVVLFILDRRMTKTDKSFGLLRVIPKILLQTMSGDLSNSCLSTSHFLHVCERVNYNKLEYFFQQWVYGSGYPIFRITQRFNKKRMFVEMGIRQMQVSERKMPVIKRELFVNDAKQHLSGVELPPIQPVFTGPMTIRIHEADGTPYEHIVDLKEGFTKLDIQYNTKYKRLKRNQRQKERQENGDDNDGVLLHCLGDVLQSDQEVEEWGLVDWTKDEEDKMTNEAFEWIRVDADFEWICEVHLQQPDYMFASQLQQDRDVEAQFDSVRYFESHEPQSRLYSTILVRTLVDDRYFYGIRVEAAVALSRLAKAELGSIGMKHLLKAYQEMFCFKNSTIPLPNDFSDFPKFFVQVAIPGALASIRDSSGNCSLEIKNFLLDLLRYNDNSSNEFSDGSYTSKLIRSVTVSMEKGDPQEALSESDIEFKERAISEILRYQKMDEWIPSYMNTVTVESLKHRCTLAFQGIADLPFYELVQYTKPNYPNRVRTTAFKCIFALGGWMNETILHYSLLCCIMEGSQLIRERIIAEILKGIGSFALYGPQIVRPSSGYNSADNGFIVIEEAGSSQINARRDELARTTLDGCISILRREFAGNKSLQTQFWNVLQSPLFDVKQKRKILDVCDLLFIPIDKFFITLPTPRSKKLVAKHLGTGHVVIKREGRLKIQLIAPPKNRLSISKPLTPISNSIIKSVTKSSTKQSISLSTLNVKPIKIEKTPKIKLGTPVLERNFSFNNTSKKPKMPKRRNTPLSYFVKISLKKKKVTILGDQPHLIKHASKKMRTSTNGNIMEKKKPSISISPRSMTPSHNNHTPTQKLSIKPSNRVGYTPTPPPMRDSHNHYERYKEELPNSFRPHTKSQSPVPPSVPPPKKQKLKLKLKFNNHS